MIRTLCQTLLFACALTASACLSTARGDEPVVLQPDTSTTLSRIAFGSCCRQGAPQPIWDSIVAADPDVFLFIGDNIYGDSEDIEVLRAKYGLLGAQPEFQRLRASCPLLATWDDHDYGVNDGGEEFPIKRESQQLMLDFFHEPADSPRRSREGVYHAWTFGPEGRRVQIILLDTRYFRSPLKRGQAEVEPGEGHPGVYMPDDNPDLTMLGERQWAWLAEQLRQPAEVRILASSIQLIAKDHNWEAWCTMPRQRQRLLDLIRETGASGLVVVSGDRHKAEISRLEAGEALDYPLYDITSSSLNVPSRSNEVPGVRFGNELNRHRVGLVWFETNYGMITIDWNQPDPLLRLQVCAENGAVVLQQRVLLSELQAR